MSLGEIELTIYYHSLERVLWISSLRIHVRFGVPALSASGKVFFLHYSFSVGTNLSSAIKREVMWFACRWMRLEVIRLSELSHRETNICFLLFADLTSYTDT